METCEAGPSGGTPSRVPVHSRERFRGDVGAHDVYFISYSVDVCDKVISVCKLLDTKRLTFSSAFIWEDATFHLF
ncbi:hypothetical protein AV530_010694 [Patagioenas fasciata monilis]|uniref:Uncharacterized protein n=1 Tax=Patagioenas fasciata monilis TaxID=372326 RepID=A0A1V4K7D7_PATFA|nr:hypothetical protein AV530_010694 [Patagioenas fasciata monilis]